MRLDEKSLGEGDTHSPTTGHVLGRLLHHLGGETKTVQDHTGLGVESAGVELLELFVLHLEGDLVDDIGNGHLLDLLLKLGDLGLGGSNDVVDSVGVGRLSLTGNDVDVDVLGDLDITSSESGKESGLTRNRSHRGRP